jgi:thiol-disulfide isomerase/thioredoxin
MTRINHRTLTQHPQKSAQSAVHHLEISMIRKFTVALVVLLALSALAADSDPAVVLKTLDYDGLKKLIASHKGKVVVMDCWSTSCAPCIKEFPKLVALHKQYGPKKLACISLSFDYDGSDKIEEVRPPVLAFLERQKATFDNVLSSTPSDELSKKLEIPAIPAVFVYDHNGKVAKRFEGNKAYDEVPALVEKLTTGGQRPPENGQ